MLRRLACLAMLACNVAVLLAALFPGSVRTSLAADRIAAEQGRAYVVGLPFKDSAFFTVSTDGSGSGSRSRLVLRENGTPLGPSHAPHSVVREQGGGAYSHWRNELWFSTSDGSDPRGNGKTYIASAKRELQFPVLAGLAALDVISIWFARRGLARTTRRLFGRRIRPVLLAIALTALAAPALALLPSLLGLSGPVGRNAALSDSGAHASSVLVHALLGLLVAAGIWLSGMGAAVLALRSRLFLREEPSAAAVLALGFPFGAIIVGLASILLLTVPAGRVLAAACVLAPALALLHWRPEPGGRRAIFRVAGQTAGFAFALAIVFGMTWRGPVLGSPSTLSGDMNFFAATIVNLSLSPFPLRNLGNEGEFFVHIGSLVLLVGAALHRIFAIDPSLFLSAGLGAFYTMSVGLAVAGFLRVRNGPLDGVGVGLVALGAIAAGRYPSWITESPSVALAVPFGISILTMAVMPGGPAVNRILPLLIAFPATITSKVAAGLVFCGFAASGIVGGFRRLPRSVLVVLGFLGLGLAALGAALVAKFWAFMVTAQGIGPESRAMVMRWNAPWSAVWPYALRDLAVLPLALCLLRSQPWALAAALGAALLLGIVLNTFLMINFVVALLAAALLMGTAQPIGGRVRKIALIAIAMCVPAMLFTDPAGLETGVPFVWVVALGGTAVSACLARPSVGGPPTVTTYVSAAASAAALIALTAFAAGTYRPLPVTHSTLGPITSEAADIWREVRERTPQDALIFTDQTSAEPTLLGGWNTFSANGGRQVFLSNYYQSSELRNDPARRDAKLDQNRRVLSGALSPDGLSLSRSYSSYFAVTSNAAPPPPMFRLIVKNAAWSLYEIKTERTP